MNKYEDKLQRNYRDNNNKSNTVYAQLVRKRGDILIRRINNKLMWLYGELNGYEDNDYIYWTQNIKQ